MTKLRQVAQTFGKVKDAKNINWHPGHMYTGMRAMIGKLSTVDCVIEVHDARIPFIGRNREFRQHLGTIKPHLLVLNKSDLADLRDWDQIRDRLSDVGDSNVLLTDMSGGPFSHTKRGYPNLLQNAVELINQSDRCNRDSSRDFKVMIVGIPNVGKSTLINRLRQHHLGLGGEAARTGNMAGVTRKVESMVKICARPLIYSIDTPGVLEPRTTKKPKDALALASCSTINDRVLDPEALTTFMLNYLNRKDTSTYQHYLGLERPVINAAELHKALMDKEEVPEFMKMFSGPRTEESMPFEKMCWKFVKLFRSGRFGAVMFE